MKLFNSTLLSIVLISAIAPMNAATKTTKAKVAGWAGAAGVLGAATLLHIYTSIAHTPVGLMARLKTPVELPINPEVFNAGVRCQQSITALAGAALTYGCFQNFKAARAEAKKENQEKTA